MQMQNKLTKTVSAGQYSFIHTASKVWNSLPDHVVGTISHMGLESFESSVHRFLLENGNS